MYEIICLSDNPVFTQPRCIWGRKLSRNFQILNPKLQIIKVACNSQLLKSSSSSHATLTASFSYSSSKPPLHLGTLTASHNSQVWCLSSNSIWNDTLLVDWFGASSRIPKVSNQSSLVAILGYEEHRWKAESVFLAVWSYSLRTTSVTPNSSSHHQQWSDQSQKTTRRVPPWTQAVLPNLSHHSWPQSRHGRDFSNPFVVLPQHQWTKQILMVLVQLHFPNSYHPEFPKDRHPHQNPSWNKISNTPQALTITKTSLSKKHASISNWHTWSFTQCRNNWLQQNRNWLKTSLLFQTFRCPAEICAQKQCLHFFTILLTAMSERWLYLRSKSSQTRDWCTQSFQST